MCPTWITQSFVSIISIGCVLAANVIELRSFVPDPKCQKDFFNFGNLQLRTPKPGVTRLAGQVELLQNIGPNLNFDSNLLLMDPRGPQEMSSITESICQLLLDKAPPMWRAIVQPQLSKCPVPKRKYVVQDFVIKDSFLMYMKPANYTIVSEVLRGKNKICGATITFAVVNK